jgi:hypothetical protein
MKALMVGFFIAAVSLGVRSEVVDVQVGKTIDDEGIPRTIIIFNDYDIGKKYHDCKVGDGYDVPTYLISKKNKIIPACWLPAHTDGIGGFRYEISGADKEFDFNEKTMKFKRMKLDINTLKLVVRK